MKHRVRKRSKGGVPGAKNPVGAVCEKGHKVKVNSKRKTVRCQICRGVKTEDGKFIPRVVTMVEIPLTEETIEKSKRTGTIDQTQLSGQEN